MTPERLDEIAQELRAYLPAEEGMIDISGANLDEMELSGNRAGLLHLAAALISAVKGDSGGMPVAMRSSSDARISIYSISCDDSLVPPPPLNFLQRTTERFMGVGCFVIVLLFVIGAVSMFAEENRLLAIVTAAFIAVWFAALIYNSVSRKKS